MSFAITGVHHIGLAVRDIDVSFEWYSRMFGVTPGAVNHGAGHDLARSVQVDNAELKFAMIDLGSTRLEFLQYLEPIGADFDRRNCDVGSAHLCLEVDDMDAAYTELVGKGAVFNGPPVTITEGELAGSIWAYLRDPDGIQLEIWASPRS